ESRCSLFLFWSPLLGPRAAQSSVVFWVSFRGLGSKHYLLDFQSSAPLPFQLSPLCVTLCTFSLVVYTIHENAIRVFFSVPRFISTLSIYSCISSLLIFPSFVGLCQQRVVSAVSCVELARARVERRQGREMRIDEVDSFALFVSLPF